MLNLTPPRHTPTLPIRDVAYTQLAVIPDGWANGSLVHAVDSLDPVEHWPPSVNCGDALAAARGPVLGFPPAAP